MNALQKIIAGGGVALVAGALAQSNLLSFPVAATEAKKDDRHKVVVVGGGTGGVTVAAQLLRRANNDISVQLIEPKSEHWYQPMWTMVGGHMGFSFADSKRPQKDVIPPGACWLQTEVAAFLPEKNSIKLANGQTITYDSLVVSMGLKNDYEKIPGLKEALADPKCPVGSIYAGDYAEKTKRVMGAVTKGDALFTQPNCPIKCGGAPQKVMWLWESEWRKRGVREDVNVSYFTNLPAMFHVPKYAAELNKMAVAKNVDANYQTDLIKVDGPKCIATFKRLLTGEIFTKPFTALHVTPYMSPPAVVSSSKLANAAGFVDVDKTTLQHTKFPNVFALGDSSSLPTSKTAAAIASQAPVLVSNLLHRMKGETMTASYDGYTSCPILVGDGQLMLAEFTFAPELKITETFPYLDQAKPNRLFYYMKRDFFPWCYWNTFLKGSWYGHNMWFFPKNAK